MKHVPNGGKKRTFLQSFTYMKINLDIFTRQQLTVYTRAGKRMVLIREMGSVPKISGDLAEMELFNRD